MFRVTDPQTTFGSLSVVLSPEKVARLENGHWAGTFRAKAWPVLLGSEGQFAALFCADNGRPNKSVSEQLGVLILKEMFDLTWEQTLEAVEFNLAWQYALDMELEEAHACQKTLHNFCHRMDEAAANGEVLYARLFDEIVSRIVADLGLNVSRQRLDSTHIRSNMKILSRLGLFVQTITCFLKDMRKCHSGMYGSLPAGMRKRYVDREGYFADSPSSEGRRRLEQSAADLWRLVDRFRGHKTVTKMKTYQRLVRLLEEQCVVEEDGTPTDPDGDGPDGVPVRAKDPQTEKIPGTSLQGSDDDATYGHKGKGYQVQVAETCVAENVVQVVTHLALEGAHESDQHATVQTIEALAEKDCKPNEMLADTGYSSGENIVAAAGQGVTLVSPSSGSAPEREGNRLILDDFTFSADGQRLEQCPAGHAPIEQGACGSEGQRRYARMDSEVCSRCPRLEDCPWRWNGKEETITLTWTPPQAAMANRRREEEGKPFKDTYRVRSGIEATNSEYKRRYGGGRLRVRGRPKVQRVVYFKFTALNIRRWLRAVCQSAEKAAFHPVEKAA